MACFPASSPTSSACSISSSPTSIVFASSRSHPFSPSLDSSLSCSSLISQTSLRLISRRGRSVSSVNVTAFHTGTANTDAEALRDDRTSPKIRAANTLYDLLGVPQTASETDIKSAYRRQARRCHPDVVPLQDREASTKTFLQIHAAYVALSDPQSRARYDLQLSIQGLQGAGYGSRFSRVAANAKATSPSPIRSSTSYCSPRSPISAQGRGRSWETDQCWC